MERDRLKRRNVVACSLQVRGLPRGARLAGDALRLERPLRRMTEDQTVSVARPARKRLERWTQRIGQEDGSRAGARLRFDRALLIIPAALDGDLCRAEI